MIYVKNITKYDGMFEKCFMEPTIHGFSVFDINGTFVGEMLNEGFAIETTYQYSEEITRKLIKKGISVFDYDTFYEIKWEKEISELLYGEPD
jgi:hypothetical protein